MRVITICSTLASAAILTSGLASGQVAKEAIVAQSTLSCTGKYGAGSFAVTSWSLGVQSSPNSASSGGTGAGKPVLSPFTLVKGFDECSAALFAAAVRGSHLKTFAVAETVGGVPGLSVTLEDVLISQYALGDGGDAVAPAESIGVTYGRITIKNSANGTSSCWDAGKQSWC